MADVIRRRALCLGAIGAALALAGCASPSRLATPTGRPEIEITGVPKKQIVDRLASNLAGQGFQVRSVNEFALVATKPVDSPVLQAVYGSQFNRVPEFRHTYAFTDAPAGVRVLGRFEIVTNPGSAFEKPEDVTQEYGAAMQSGLERFAASFR